MINEPHVIRTITALVKKELGTYFNSPIAYIVITIFLVVANWLFFKTFFLVGQASLRGFFDLLPWLLLFLAPALTMRLWAEEKKSGTFELLMTLPINSWQAVLAKFIGSFIFLLLILALTINIPITVANLGSLDWGPVVGGYIGAVFIGLVFLAVGLLLSALTKNQIVALISTLAVCFLALVAGSNFVLMGLPDLAAKILAGVGLANHYSNLAKGVLDTKDFVYFFSVVFFCLWLNSRWLEARKW
jgi:ABC-2 type transport system permease protein